MRPLAESIDRGFISKLRMAMKETLGKEEDWDPNGKRGNPCSSPLVESYLTCVINTQKQVGVPVKQAAPLLTNDLPGCCNTCGNERCPQGRCPHELRLLETLRCFP